MTVKRITQQQFWQVFLLSILLTTFFNYAQAQNTGSFVSGVVFLDDNDDCEWAQDENGLQGWTVRATETTLGGTQETTTSQFGFYNLFLQEPDQEYLIEVVPPADFTAASCITSYIVETPMEVDTIIFDSSEIRLDFPITSLTTDCPHYTFVDVGGWRMRRCFDNTFDVQYCNFGLEDEEDVYVEVDLDDFLSLTSSSIPFSSENENTYTFDIGDLPSGECGTFTITALLSCDAELGQTHCLEARIFPDTSCTQVDPLWSGASLEVSGACNGSEVEFTITNTGDGNMEAPVDFIVVEDHIIMMQGSMEIPALQSGESHVVTREANGATYRLEVDQVEFHPGGESESATIEACTEGTVFSTGFVTQLSENDEEPYISILCMENRDSYDPNEKRAYPKGFSDAHYIEANTELEYVLHFQNTGTDTAFTVVIEDQLSQYLKPASIRTGVSSHPYTYTLNVDGKLTFTFEDIMLPDSNINEAASNGYVKFKIDQQRDLPIGTVINNEAAIFFDFNDPIITNQTFHKINEDFIEVVITSVNSELIGAEIAVGPNPFRDKTTIRLDGLEYDNYQLNLFDLQGKLLRTESFNSNSYEINRNHLQKGVYIFHIQSEGQWIASGKLMIQ